MGNIIKQEPVSTKSAYGVIRSKNLKAGDYQLQVVNFGDPNSDSDFSISTFAEQTIEILEQQAALEAAISRAMNLSPQDVITSRFKTDNVTFVAKQYLDFIKQSLHLSLEKSAAQNSTILLEIQTS